MNELLLDRQTGCLDHSGLAVHIAKDLLSAFRAAPRLRFNGGEQGILGAPDAPRRSGAAPDAASHDRLNNGEPMAHRVGVNALALEQFDGRMYEACLVSGGADGCIRLWDLEQADAGAASGRGHTYMPAAELRRATSSSSTSTSSSGHRFGVTHLSFYPFDAAAFLSSSFDQSLRLWSTEGPRLAGVFDLAAKVYHHAISPIADHMLVACATQHPAVRLIDLRSGAAVQSLVAPGQEIAGAVLAAAWSPRHAHVLASAAVDGTVRLWDVRRANALLGLLDQEDHIGHIGGSVGHPHAIRRHAARAHTGPVNALAWTDDGAFIVSAGHDRRIRVWDAASGTNTLVNFGPAVRNSGGGDLGSASAQLLLTPTGLAPAREELLVWGNGAELLLFGLHDGRLVTRLRAAVPPPRPAAAGRAVPRVTSVVWRGAGGRGSTMGGTEPGGHDAVGGLYSGHQDGRIRAWVPRLGGQSPSGHNEGEDDAWPLLVDDADSDGGHTLQAVEERARKRHALDQAYRSLMGTQITFQ